MALENEDLIDLFTNQTKLDVCNQIVLTISYQNPIEDRKVKIVTKLLLRVKEPPNKATTRISTAQ